MRLAQKLILFSLAVALIPLAATGFTLIRVSEEALRQRIAEHQQAAAVAVAAKVAQAVEEVARRLETVMSLVVVTELTPAERTGVARMLYRQAEDIGLVLLVDAQRRLLVPPEYLAAEDLVGDLGRHPAAVAEDAARLLSALPLPETAPAAVAYVSPVYFPEGGGAARVAIAVPCCTVDGRPTAFAGVEVWLRREVLRVEGVDTGEQSAIFVVDTVGRAIAHPHLPIGAEMGGHGAVSEWRRTGLKSASIVETPTGRFAAAVAPVGSLGWAVVVEQPEAVAYAVATRMRQQTLIWILISIAVVLTGGLLFAGRLRRVLARLTEGARSFGEGRLTRQIEVVSTDELGELAGTMNSMAGRLAESLRELQNWSLTLEQRVAERTRELQSTQAQLLTQSKLAAIGQLGAGVAHEVNNPLAGVLGLVQLMLRQKKPDDPEHARLKDIETAAKRCRDIVMRLLRFSEQRLVGRTRVQLNEVVDEVVEMVAEGFASNQIVVHRELAADLPPITADPGQLTQVLVNVLNNSRTAMPKGGEVHIVTARYGEQQVRLTIRDTGVGIEAEHLPRIFDPFFTTKRVWTDVGLGLSVVFRVVQDHGGTITAESEVGRGATIIVTLPLEPPEKTAAEVELPPRKMVLLE